MTVDSDLRRNRFLVAIVITLIIGTVLLREMGDGERKGIVVYTRKASFPVKRTLVWIRLYYTDGIMNEDSFVREFYGWHDFELGQLYKIQYHREWHQIYKRITNLEIIEK